MSFWDEDSTEEYFDNRFSIDGGNPAAITGLIGLGIMVVGILVIIAASYWDSWFTDIEQVPASDNPENEALPTEMTAKHWVAGGGIIGSMVGVSAMVVSAGILGGGAAVRTAGRAAKSTAGFYIGLIIVMIIGVIIALSAHYYDNWYFNVLGKDKKVTFAHTFGPATDTAQTTAMWIGIGIAGLAALVMIGRLAFRGAKKGIKMRRNLKAYEKMTDTGMDSFREVGFGKVYRSQDDEMDIY